MLKTLTSRAARRALCSLVGGLLYSTGGVVAPASAHGVALRGAAKLSERRLRAFESATLGPEHAAEHARARRLERDPEYRAGVRRAAKRARAAGVRARASALPSEDGKWAAPFSIPTVAIHAALLPTGKVLWFDRPNQTPFQVSLYDPVTDTTKMIDPPQIDGHAANIFCAGQSFLPDGRLLVVGGQLANQTATEEFKGLNSIFTFNPWNETWTRQPDMGHGRWYPTNALQPDGRTVILDGYDESGVRGAPHNDDVDVFTPSPDLDGVGTVTSVATRGATGTGLPPRGGLYPHALLLPSGKTLVAGPFPEDSWLFDPLSAGPFSWSDVKNPANHIYGGGVILPSDTPGSAKVELVGGNAIRQGGDAPDGAATEIFDADNPSEGWRPGKPLTVPRSHLNTVLLPDGSMVAVGGGKGKTSTGSLSAFWDDDLKVDLWNPVDGTWHAGAAQQEGRAYHSTALLLPDGRVISAGDDTNGGMNADTAEIYSPPYLSKGPRPTITSTPGALPYDQGFDVTYGTTDVEKAVLVAPSAVTHANDMNQRYVPLTIASDAGGTLRLGTPANANLAPPGWYMLFLVNRAGVPSVAKFIRLDASLPAGAPTPPANTDPAGPTPPNGATTNPLPTSPASTTGTGSTPAIATGSTPTSTGATPTVTGPPQTRPTTRLMTAQAFKPTLRALRAGALRAPVSCARTCRVRAWLTLDRKVAHKLDVTRGRGSGTVVIGSGSVLIKAPTHNGRVVVALTETARRRLARTRSFTVRLRLTASDGQASQTITRTLRLAR